MNEAAGARSSSAQPTAGRLLREAREKQGLHIAALAAAIKVTPKKLELLESDRFDLLPDATFTRALAQTVCRALKTDPAPVMRLLPASGHRLEHLGEGLNTPFRERPGLSVQRDGVPWLTSPWFWAVLLVLGAAVLVYFLPAGVTGFGAGRPPAAPAASSIVADPVAAAPMPEASSVAVAPAAPVVAPPDSSLAPAQPLATPGAAALPAPAASAPAVAVSSTIQLRTSAPSWIEVTDGRGQSLIARLVQAGESVGLDGAPPFRVRIGNAAATRLEFRGQPTALAGFTRDNVARLELR